MADRMRDRTPLDPAGLRAVIERLSDEIDGECMEGQRNWRLAVLRGLIWALRGEDPGSLQRVRPVEIFQLAGYLTVVSPCGEHFHACLTEEALTEDLRECEGCAQANSSQAMGHP